jgi:hypothetical protein
MEIDLPGGGAVWKRGAAAARVWTGFRLIPCRKIEGERFVEYDGCIIEPLGRGYI